MKHTRRNYFEIFFLVIVFIVSSNSNFAFTKATDSLTIKMEQAVGEGKILLLHKLIKKNFREDLQKAKEYGNTSLQLSFDSEVDSLVTHSYYLLGVAHYYLDNWTLSSDYYLKAINSKWGQTANHVKYKCTNNLGINYELLGDYEKSAEYYYETLNAMIEIKDSLQIGKTLMNLGLLMTRIEDYDEAKVKFLEALPIFKKYNNQNAISLCYQNLFIVELYNGNIKEAKTYFENALKSAESLEDPAGLTILYQDYANGLSGNEKYSEALKYYEKALSICNSENNPTTYSLIQSGIGNALLQTGRVKEAEKMLFSAREGFKEYSANVWLTTNELYLAQLYAKTCNWNNFKFYLNEYIDLNSKLFEDEKMQSISEMEVAYETAKKDHQIEIQEITVANQQKQLWFVSGISVTLLIGFIITQILRKQLKEKNQKLFGSNMELTRRWEQMQKFYSSVDSERYDDNDISLFSKINKLLSENLIYTQSDLTVTTLAKHLNTNSKYVSQAINEQTGMNFNTFINTFRIEEAKKVLRDKEAFSWTLEAIAEKCGFNNQTSFIHAFKKNTGLTPSAFRKAS